MVLCVIAVIHLALPGTLRVDSTLVTSLSPTPLAQMSTQAPLPHWKLRSSKASPFGRKVRMAIAAIGRTDSVEMVPADTSDPEDSLRTQNPLGKIPTLLLEDGQPLFDSRVIVDFLDQQDGRHILVPAGPARYDVLRQQALADGLMDAAILQVYENRYRPEDKRVQTWLDYQQEKVDRALRTFAASLPSQGESAPHIGEIALAAALGYLDFRFNGTWRSAYPEIAAWLEAFAQRFPAYGQTQP